MSKEQCPHVHHAASKHFDAASGCLCSSFAPASSDLAPTPCLSSISTSSSSCQVLQLNDSCRRCSFYGICFIWAHWKFERTAKNSLFTLNLVKPEPPLPVSFSVLSSCNFPLQLVSVSSAALSSIFSFAALTASTFAPGASHSPIPIQHPFLWLWSWVEWSPRQMDVLLTAVCCCLVPTPVNSHVRAHNLLQVSS